MTGTSPPIALTIAGSDSSGGAGIQADLKTFSALGVYGATVLTALTAQNTRGVDAILAVPPDFIAKQIAAVASDLAVGATKTGMLADRATVEAVASSVKRHRLAPLIVDPVMVATSGDVLLAPDAIEALKNRLIPLADVITPNLHEAARLLDAPVATSEDEMEAQARGLRALGCQAVLVKGGHGPAGDAVDLLFDGERVTRLALPRIATRNTHGTGCTLSAAIAAHLAQGVPLAEAARRAKSFVWGALQSGAGMTLGHGAGPVDHLHSTRGPGPSE